MGIVEEIYTEVFDILSDGIQPVDDLVALTGLVMTIIQRRKELSKRGDLKREIITTIFMDLANKSGLFTKEQAETMTEFIANSLPIITDNLKRLARAIYENVDKNSCCPKPFFR